MSRFGYHREILDYKFAHGKTMDELYKEIEKLTEKGYECKGICHYASFTGVYSRQMVKYDIPIFYD